MVGKKVLFLALWWCFVLVMPEWSLNANLCWRTLNPKP